MILSFKTAVLSAAVLATVFSCEGPADNEAEQDAMVQPAADDGEYSTAGAALTWSRDGSVVIFRVLYEAPSACFSAGPMTHSVTQPGNAVLIKADVAFQDATCAQMITVVKFEGTADGIEGPFSIGAVITDTRSGEEIALPDTAEE
jgi:hypothetical protein